METKNTIPFDPGYAPLVINSIGQVGYIYYMFNAVPNVKIKKQNFLAVSIKIEKFLRENIAFYLGCLLWASYIKQFNNYEITGNKLLDQPCSEEEYTGEINFLIDLIENKYPRDYKYFKNKNYVSDEKYLPILKAYKEFLILNNGFVNCSNTNQVILPSCVKTLDSTQYNQIFNEIQNALNSKKLESLFDSYSLLF